MLGSRVGLDRRRRCTLGASARRGYVDPSEAAWELLGAAVEPFLVRLRQLAKIGLHAAAIELGAGILLGLVEAKGDDECAIFFDEDFAVERRTRRDVRGGS